MAMSRRPIRSYRAEKLLIVCTGFVAVQLDALKQLLRRRRRLVQGGQGRGQTGAGAGDLGARPTAIRYSRTAASASPFNMRAIRHGQESLMPRPQRAKSAGGIHRCGPIRRRRSHPEKRLQERCVVPAGEAENPPVRPHGRLRPARGVIALCQLEPCVPGIHLQGSRSLQMGDGLAVPALAGKPSPKTQRGASKSLGWSRRTSCIATMASSMRPSLARATARLKWASAERRIQLDGPPEERDGAFEISLCAEIGALLENRQCLGFPAQPFLFLPSLTVGENLNDAKASLGREHGRQPARACGGYCGSRRRRQRGRVYPPKIAAALPLRSDRPLPDNLTERQSGAVRRDRVSGLGLGSYDEHSDRGGS